MTTARSGPGASHIVKTYANTPNDWYQNVVRTGTSSFGWTHIQIGGSTRNTMNHPIDSVAQLYWQRAMDNWVSGVGGSIPFANGRLATYQFTGTGGIARMA